VTTGAEYQRVAAAIRATFPHAAVAPGLVVGASDGRHYEGLARAVFRFAPYTLGKDDLARLHDNNERIAIADYMRAIAFYERLISGQRWWETSGIGPGRFTKEPTSTFDPLRTSGVRRLLSRWSGQQEATLWQMTERKTVGRRIASSSKRRSRPRYELSETPALRRGFSYCIPY
jgi:Peptidase family M20/M25/M40